MKTYKKAYSQGAQTQYAGIAKQSTDSYAAYTIHQYDKIKNTAIPNYSNSGVQEYSDAKGVWCKGIKPKLDFLGDYMLGTENKPRRVVANFYEYLELTNEDGLSAQNKLNRFSQYGDVYQTPQYRGVCIQFESTDGTRAIPAETFITKINATSLRDETGRKVVDDPLTYYSRNGTFADSSRIVSPKPTNLDKVLSNQYWLWYASHTDSGFKVEFKIPGIFSAPEYADDLPKCPTGPLYTSATMLNFVEFNACSDGTSLSCIKSMYEKAGGKEEGTWFPKGVDEPADVVFKDSKRTIRRSPEEVLEYFKEEKAIALGTSPILTALTAEQKAERMNQASIRLMGKSVVSPCQTVVDAPAPGGLVIQNLTGNLPVKCLDEIYRQTYDSSFAPTTYSDIRDRYSGIRKDELALPEIQKNFPYRTCQPTGSWAPIKLNGDINDVAVAEINAAIKAFGAPDSVVGARGVFNKVYQDANGATDKAVQQLAMERCYGVKKKEFVSNCQGIKTKKIRVLLIYNIYIVNMYIQPGGNFITSDKIPEYLPYIQALFPNSTVATLSQLEIIRKKGYVTGGAGWISSPSGYEKKIIKLYTSETGIEDRPNNTGSPLFIYIKTDLDTSQVISNLLTVKDTNQAQLICKTNVDIVDISINKTSLTSTKVFYLNKDDAKWSSTFTLNDAQTILRTIQTVYSSADITSEETLRKVTDNQFGYAGWFKSGTTYKQGYLSSDANGKFTLNIRNTNTEKASMFVTIQTNEEPLTIITKLRTILNNYTAIQGTSAIAKLYDEDDEGKYEYTGTVQSIDVQTLENTNAIVQLLGDGDRVLTQRLATSSTLEFNQIDVVPTLSYRDLEFPAQGTQRIRLESFVGQGWFLTIDGVKGEISKTAATTFTLIPSKSFRSPSSLSPSSLVAKVYTLESGTTKLFRNSSNGIGGTITTNIDANSSWVILPALNGASAFVSLQLANYPRVFLTTQVNADGSYTPLCVELGLSPTDLEKALTCWKLYPSDM